MSFGQPGMRAILESSRAVSQRRRSSRTKRSEVESGRQLWRLYGRTGARIRKINPFRADDFDRCATTTNSEPAAAFQYRAECISKSCHLCSVSTNLRKEKRTFRDLLNRKQ